MAQLTIDLDAVRDKLAQTRIASSGFMWGMQSNKDKEADLAELGNIVARNYLKCRAENAEYEPLRTEIQLAIKGGGGGGCAGYDVLVRMDETFDRNNAISVMAHEATHHGQYLFKQQDRSTLSEANQKRHDVLRANDYYHCSTVFGFKTEDAAYFPSETGKLDRYNGLRSAFYVLCPLEREAIEAEIDIAKQLGFKGHTRETLIDPSLKVLRERYLCKDMADDQVFALLDQAIVNIAVGVAPRDAREASITYDYAALLYGQRDFKSYVESLHMMKPESKFQALVAAGYNTSDPIMQELAKTVRGKANEPIQQKPTNELFRDDSTYGNCIRNDWEEAGIDPQQEDFGRIY